MYVLYFISIFLFLLFSQAKVNGKVSLTLILIFCSQIPELSSISMNLLIALKIAKNRLSVNIESCMKLFLVVLDKFSDNI